MPAPTITVTIEVTLHEDLAKSLDDVTSTTGRTSDSIVSRCLRDGLPRILREWSMPFSETNPPTRRGKTRAPRPTE